MLLCAQVVLFLKIEILTETIAGSHAFVRNESKRSHLHFFPNVTFCRTQVGLTSKVLPAHLIPVEVLVCCMPSRLVSVSIASKRASGCRFYVDLWLHYLG